MGDESQARGPHRLPHPNTNGDSAYPSPPPAQDLGKSLQGAGGWGNLKAMEGIWRALEEPGGHGGNFGGDPRGTWGNLEAF